MPELNQIPELLSTIQQTVDSQDADGFANCWTQDAILNLLFEDGAKMSIEGRDAILQLAAGGWTEEASPLRHLVGSVAVKATGAESAQAESYAIYIVPGEQPASPGVGFYDDNLVIDEGRWRIKMREHRFLNPIHIAGNEEADKGESD